MDQLDYALYNGYPVELAELAAEYVDILNEHPRPRNDMTYAPSGIVQRQHITQEINYGLTYSKKGFTKEGVFEYASHSINNFGLIKIMNEWWPKLERLQLMYKERQRCLDEMKNNIRTNTAAFNSNWLSI